MTRTFVICRKKRRRCSRAIRLALCRLLPAETGDWRATQPGKRRRKNEMATQVKESAKTGAVNAALSNEEVLRYSRHLIMPEVGMDGQLKLKKAKVLLIGSGGLGAPLGLYLAAAGVGRLGIVDFDKVDLTNLQRQILFSTTDVGRPKIEAAADRLRAMNPDVQIDTFETQLTSANALDILKDYDIIVDGTDNFPTRYLVNDASVMMG